MPVFEEFPYTNFHELNLDWIIKEIKEMRADLNEALLDNFTITYANPIQWSILVPYDKYVLVLDSSDVAYLSMQEVPSGTALTNTNYWIEIGDFYQLLNTALTNFAPNQKNNPVATSNYANGSLVVLNYILYRLTADVTAGTVLTEGTNITRITLNGMKSNYDSQLSSLSSTVSTNSYDIGVLQNDILALPTNDDIYYKAGDTITLDQYSAYSGWTANAGKSIFVTIPLPKLLTNITGVSVDSTFKSAIRVCEGGYINNSQYVDISGYINGINILKGSNQLRIEILDTVSWTYGPGSTNVTVNAPVSFMVNDTVTLSLV